MWSERRKRGERENQGRRSRGRGEVRHVVQGEGKRQKERAEETGRSRKWKWGEEGGKGGQRGDIKYGERKQKEERVGEETEARTGGKREDERATTRRGREGDGKENSVYEGNFILI